MVRRWMFLGAVLLTPLGAGLYVVASQGSSAAVTPKFDNSTDTVNCAAFVGKAQVQPELQLNGTSPTTIRVTGKLYGCTDATERISGNSTLVGLPFSGSVSGTLTGTSNDLSTLQGCSSTEGTLTAKWKGWYYDPITSVRENLLYTATVVTLHQIFGTTFAPGAPFGTDNMTTDGYGVFDIGKAATDNGCTAPSYTSPGAFLGTDGGVTSSTVAVTGEDTTAILAGQTNHGNPVTNFPATKTILDIGLGAYYGG